MGKDGILPKFRHATITWLYGNGWMTTNEVYAFLKDKFRRGPSMAQITSMLSQSPEFQKRKQGKIAEWSLK